MTPTYRPRVLLPRAARPRARRGAQALQDAARAIERAAWPLRCLEDGHSLYADLQRTVQAASAAVAGQERLP